MKRPVPIEADDLSGISRYVDEAWKRWPGAPPPDQPPARPDSETLSSDPERALRRYRQLGSVHLLWKDLTGRNSIEDTGKGLSALARDCIELALSVATDRLQADFGVLRDPEDRPVRMAVIGMGKLGGDELNFNSDIDLVFIHRGTGKSDGRRSLDAGTYLKRVALELIRLLDSVTAEGRAWVVDTRLRPFGSAGALVWSLGAIEQYFLNEGRPWERYAWMKAAPVAGDLETAERLLESINPFIYRRYLDYGIFESLRELHDRIDAKSRLDSRREDIKRGPGGIRELEFLVQSQQILRGGRDPALQQRGFLPALRALTQARIIDSDSEATLRTSYGFLRILENRLQAQSGRQTHHLPDSSDDRATLARLMGASDWAALHEDIERNRTQVRVQFDARFGDHCVVESGASGVWPPDDDLEGQLQQTGVGDSEEVGSQLRSLAQRLAHRALSAEGRARLERLMPSLLRELAGTEHPATGLADLLQLIEQISQRSAYLALLHERPATLSRLIQVFQQSRHLAEWIVASPQLLDDLLDPIHGLELPDPPAVDHDDPEATLFALGRWHQAGFLRTALAEMDGAMDAVDAADQLTTVASTCSAKILELTGRDQAPMAVVAYGNLGAGLLHFDSDLDLVFLHGDGAPPLRSAQRFLSYMQLPLPGGRLFEIDTRLRPNGNAGTLVSSLAHFARYQADQAETWEHQSLIRARWIAGDRSLEEGFEVIRRSVLCIARDPAVLRPALSDMRARQKRERKEDPVKSLLTDLQFIAECGVLEQAKAHTDLIEPRRPGQLFARLGAQDWLPVELAGTLTSTWHKLLALRHQRWLSRIEAPLDLDPYRPAIEQAWALIFDPPQ